MNAIELYKKLPKKNCGRCIQKTCMPFALSLIKGDANISDCPLLSEEQAAELGNLITHSDWREELIQSLRQKMEGIDLATLPDDLGGEYRDNRLFLHCLGREFEVSPDGDITSKGHITPWIRILLLHYINTHGKTGLSGNWVAYSELKSGMVKATSFEREGEDPIKELFNSDFRRVSSVLEGLGAQRTDTFPTPNAWHLSLLPRVPVMILYWPEEDEFPSRVRILFDRTADKFLDVESLIFLIEGLVKNIEHGMELSE